MIELTSSEIRANLGAKHIGTDKRHPNFIHPDGGYIGDSDRYGHWPIMTHSGLFDEELANNTLTYTTGVQMLLDKGWVRVAEGYMFEISAPDDYIALDNLTTRFHQQCSRDRDGYIFIETKHPLIAYRIPIQDILDGKRLQSCFTRENIMWVREAVLRLRRLVKNYVL